MANIRDASMGDALALAGLATQLGYPASEGQSARRLKALIDGGEHCLLVAEGEGDTVVGWVHVFLTPRMQSEPFAEIGGFVVDEHHRGRGIGKRLLAAAESWVVDQGQWTLRVRSRAGRADAHGFYQRLGFKQTKEQAVFDKPLQANDAQASTDTPR